MTSSKMLFSKCLIGCEIFERRREIIIVFVMGDLFQAQMVESGLKILFRLIR